AVRDFIRAAKTFAPGWSEYWANYRRSNPSTTPDLYGIIQKLREYRRDQGSDTHVRSHPAFATFKGNGIEDSGSTSIHLSSPSTAPQSTTHHSKPTGECLCGREHWYRDCWDLIEDIRPTSWIPNKKIMDRIQSTLENSPRLLAAVDRARQWVKKYRTKQGEEQHHSDKEGRKHHQSFAIQSPRSGFSLEGGNDSYDNEEEYKLRDSFLLDSAASIHVCNNRSRFTTFTPSTGKETMRAANSFAVIQGYGTVEVHAKSATPGDLKPCTLELLDVAYVPSFQTSLVSFGRAWAKGIRWDTNRMTLDVGNEPLCKVTRKFEQWVLEYNPLSTNSSAAMARASPPRNLLDHKPAR